MQETMSAGVIASTSSKLMELQDAAGNLHELRHYSKPNVMVSMLTFVVDIYLLCVLIAFPFLYATPEFSTGCIHPFVLFGAATSFLSFNGLLVAMNTMAKGPFRNLRGVVSDCINIDANLCHTERAVFHGMRAAYRPLPRPVLAIEGKPSDATPSPRKQDLAPQSSAIAVFCNPTEAPAEEPKPEGAPLPTDCDATESEPTRE